MAQSRDRRSPPVIKSTAYHEAGHAVVAWLQGVGLSRGSIVLEPGRHGHIRHHLIFGCMPPPDSVLPGASAKFRLEKKVRISLAGPLAQKKFNSRTYRSWHGEADHNQAADCVSCLARPDDEFVAYWKLLEVQTRNLLNRNWPLVEAVAAALLVRRTLKGPEIVKVIYAAGHTPSTMPPEIGARQATAEEARVLQVLLRCKLPPHSADLQFVIAIDTAARHGLDIMTPGRKAYLWRIARRHRDRLPEKLQSMITEG